MKIEKKDLEFLRKLELGIDLTKGVPDQIRIFEESEIVDSFGIRLFLPPIIGGKWFFILARISGLDKRIVEKFEFPIEMGINLSIPENVFPELTISYYTQDPKKEDEIIADMKPVHYETTILNEYDYPICMPLSHEEINILEILLETPIITMKDIATKLDLSPATVRAKLSRLQLDENNKGFLTVVPSINWFKIENFVHLHIGIDSGLSHEMFKERLKDFNLAIAGWYRGTIYQLEYDLWEPTGLNKVLHRLKTIKDTKLAGLLIAQKSIVVDHWISGLIRDIKNE